jgi:23S rRNA (pseudouridine1915-N3)-methyltransferase
MNIKILCVGKIREKFYRDALSEYEKRLSRYCKLAVFEVADEKTPDKIPPAQERQIREKEAARLLAQIRDTDYVIALAINGESFDSPGLARHLEQLAVSGRSSLVFVIGGSLGLDTSVTKRANECLSFSALTFPHQLMRVILLEQIYRSYRIINHEPYHK